MTSPRETVETQEWDNRELLLRIYYQVVETNGTVKDHDRQIYGHPEHDFVGLRHIANENMAYRERMKTLMRFAAAVAGTLVALLGTLLGIILDHVM